MKKNLAIMFIIPIILLSGCSLKNKSLQNSVQSDINFEVLKPTETAISPNKTAVPELETWQDAYAEFLRSFPVHADKDVQTFSLRDLDNDGVIELIIIESDGVVEALLSVYSYDDNVYKVGDYTDPKIGVAGLRVSNNSMFPGLFTLWWGGGVEHYGYLTIQEGKLISEDLWYIDRTKDLPYQFELSDNIELVNESINAHPPYDYSENLLEMYLLEEGNIAEVFRK